MKVASYEKAFCFLLVVFVNAAMTVRGGSAQPPVGVAPEHVHAQKLLANAYRYLDPAHGLIDKASGYPVEGWNEEMYLRGFTQLTAIGFRLELLACIAAGQADNPFVSREQALEDLERMVKSLQADQADPSVGAKGLLSNFLGFSGNRRLSPVTMRARKKDFVEKFGEATGARIWEDLAAAKWILLDKNGTEGQVRRAKPYGQFEGALKTYTEQGLTDAIMKLLEQRVVMIIFGDNVNLTASVAKSVGALLAPSIRDNPRAAALRGSMEQFIEKQREGYAHLYDRNESTFVFGWNASFDEFYGWASGDGGWTVGHMNYFINEFRGGWTFVVNRFGLPVDAIRAGTFKLNPYVLQNGRTVYVPAAWDGSAFQILGLSLFMQEMQTPGWRALLANAVAAELDYSTQHGLPGFLSEAYSGNGREYTGGIGVPQLAVTKSKRVTDAPSLYTLGIAYSIAPAEVEAFLAAKWPMIEKLLTDHGPWEGYQTTKKSVIEFQTTAHTLALILGFVGTGHENMARYLQNAKLPSDPVTIHRAASGPEVNLLAQAFNVFAWCREKDRLQQKREGGRFDMSGKNISGTNLAFVPAESAHLNLSGRTLQLRYRSATAIPGCVLRFTPRNHKGAMTIEATLNLAATGAAEGQFTIPMPATPALDDIKELVVVLPDAKGDAVLDFNIAQFVASP